MIPLVNPLSIFAVVVAVFAALGLLGALVNRVVS
jgi:hypothetical protein